MFFGFWGFRFSELFSKKSIPHGPSGQTAMWKRITYGSSSFQVFIKKCRKCWFLPIRFHFFMITLFSPFVRLRPVYEGFCVLDIIGILQEYYKNTGFKFAWGTLGRQPGEPSGANSDHSPLTHCIRTL